MFTPRRAVLIGLLVLFFSSLSTTASADIISDTSSTGNNTSAGATTLTITAPAFVNAGDFLLASLTYDKGASTTLSAPAGWTLIRQTDNALKVGLATYYKVANGSEPASYTWTLTPARAAVGGIVKYTGVETDNPIDTTSDATGHSDTVSAPAVVTALPNEAVIAVFGLGENRSFGAVSGMTEKFDVTNPSNSGPAIAYNDKIEANAGVVGTSSSLIGSPKRFWTAQHIALTPEPPIGTLRVTKTVVNDN